MRMFNLLEKPRQLFSRPEVMQRVIATWSRRLERDPIAHGPTREEMLERLGTAS